MAADLVDLPPGVDPVLTYPRPDVEALVWSVVKPLGGTVTWTYAVDEQDVPGWLAITSIQVDVRASRKHTAWARADAVRRSICALPWADWPQGVINRVDVTEGPFWLPEDNGAPRYIARYAITAHPRPGITEGNGT